MDESSLTTEILVPASPLIHSAESHLATSFQLCKQVPLMYDLPLSHIKPPMAA